ncbi:hypothetical protein vseg_018205 [Gypsophila vaccaria]
MWMVRDRLKEGYRGDDWCSNNGVYSVASGYEWLTGANVKEQWARMIWSRYNVPKHGFICWFSAQNRLLTKDRLVRIGIIAYGICQMCKEDNESLERILYSCPFSTRCWDKLKVSIPRFDIWRASARLNRLPLVCKQVVMALICACFYNIWIVRNNCRFHGMISHPRHILKEVWWTVRTRTRRCIKNLRREDVQCLEDK